MSDFRTHSLECLRNCPVTAIFLLWEYIQKNSV